MIAAKKRYSVLISEDDPDYQFLFKMAVADINPEIEINLVFTGEQMVQYLIKDKLERALNRQVFPNIVIGSLKEGVFNSKTLKDLRQYERLYTVPVYVFVSDFSKELREKLLVDGANEVLKKPETFHALREMLEKIINGNQPKRLTKGLFCARCEEYMEFDPNWGSLAGQIKISPEENEFIKGRFDGGLCVPCLRQLQNSYRIISGNYGSNTKSFTVKGKG